MMCVQIGERDKRHFEVIQHTPKSIDNWLNELHKTAKVNITVAVKLTKGLLYMRCRKTVLSLPFLSMD
jgi:hypothetical protein